MDDKLKEISLGIKNVIKEKQLSLGLSFTEENHEYIMNDLVTGKPRNDYPSVSKVIKRFYTPFDSEAISFRKAKGDIDIQKQLLKEWNEAGSYSTNLGSRTHYLLEKYLVDLYGNYKTIRKPIFECDEYQTYSSDKMIKGGEKYIDLMQERGAVLLDTEMVLGCNELGYTGQPDKVWLIEKNDVIGLILTDWKTNQPKNFEVHHYTDVMLYPFNDLPNTALSHYYIQLPLYMRLLLKMLKNSIYSDIQFFGGIIVLLKDDATFQEFRIPNSIINKVFDLKI